MFPLPNRPIVLALILFQPSWLRADLVKVPVNDLVAAGSATVTHVPFDIGSATNIFDDDPTTLARSANVDPAFVQVQFSAQRALGETSVRFSHALGSPAHRWKVEAADSPGDMDARSGSWILVTDWRPLAQDATDTYTPSEAVPRAIFRLTVERLTGDNYVHINLWEVFEQAAQTGVRIVPDSLAMGVGDSFQLRAEATYDNGGAADVTQTAGWATSDASVCQVDRGLVTARASGGATIRAAHGGFESFPAPATVTSHPADLDVLFIRQEPLYSRFHVDFSQGDQRIAAGYEDEKKWPDAGEAVTYTAYVQNKGDEASAPCSFAWSLDGERLATGSVPALAPSEEWSTSVVVPWPADTVQVVDLPAGAQILQPKAKERAVGDHRLRFDVDAEGAIAELSEANNSLDEFINALVFWFYVDRTTYFYFENACNYYETYSFHDWVRGQLTEMQRRMLASGIRQRIRVDRVLIYPDGALSTGGTHTPKDEGSNYAYDGTWGFQASEWAEKGAAKYRKRVQGSLLHELGHQLGMIDIYQADLATENCRITHGGAPVAGGPLMPKVSPWNVYYGEQILGHRDGAAVIDSLWRDAMGDTGKPYWGPVHVLGMNRELGLRRGFYGAFIGAIPQGTIRLRVRGDQGKPVANCGIRVFQRDRSSGQVPDSPKFVGAADASGEWAFPKVTEAAFGGYPVNNPFSTQSGAKIYNAPHAVGGDSLLVLEVQEPGLDPEYHFVSTEPFNRAFAGGQLDDFTYEITTYRSRLSSAPPELQFEGGEEQTATEGQLFTARVLVSDSDGDAVTIAVSPLANTSFDPDTRVFSFTPDSLQTTQWPGSEVKTLQVEFRADEGLWKVTRSLRIRVMDVEGLFTFTPYDGHPPPRFRRGDSNDDGRADLSDGIFTLSHLFLGAAAPGCMKSADVNDSGKVDISDPVYLLNYLFLGGPGIPEPFPGCSTDPTEDELGCGASSGCPGVDDVLGEGAWQ